jgi:hypothetical protein
MIINNSNNEEASFGTSASQQLEMFTHLAGVAGLDSSATIELLDSVPKYFQRQTEADTTKPWVQIITVRGVSWKMTMLPVTLRAKEGTALKNRFPGPREEIIEQVLRKMATDTPGVMKEPRDDNSPRQLVTTLSALRRRLEQEGHGYKISEIDEALTILDGVRFDLEGPSKVKTSGIIRRTQIGLPGDTSGDSTAIAISFHPLFYRSLAERTYRLLKYDRLIGLKRPLSRWIYQRITHYFTQAQRGGPLSNVSYHLALSFILANSTMKRYADLRNNVRQVELALKELHEAGILHPLKPYEAKPVHEESSKRGRAKASDVVFDLWPSDEVAGEIADANRKLKEQRK